MTRFVLRADASSAIGFGHLSRLMTLATALVKRGVKVRAVANRPDVAAREFVARHDVPLDAIDVETGSAADAESTRALAGPHGVIVADGYAFSSSWLTDLGAAYVDDLAREPFACAAIINPNVNGARLRYELASQTLLFAGPSYALVHPRFVAARARVQRPTVERVLVTMGGSDPPGATLAVLDALEAIEHRPDVRVIVGASNPRCAAIAARGVDVRVGVEDMAAEMTWADMAVTASGVTATELACVGVPAVTFPIVDNQEAIAVELARLGLFEVLPLLPNAAAITRAIERVLGDGELRLGMVARQRAAIDGAGADRIAAALLALPRPDRA